MRSILRIVLHVATAQSCSSPGLASNSGSVSPKAQPACARSQVSVPPLSPFSRFFPGSGTLCFESGEPRHRKPKKRLELLHPVLLHKAADHV